MREKILVVGKGFLGERLGEAFRAPISERRIMKFADIESEIMALRPKVILNCIGHTGGRNVDGCENDRDESLLANAYVPLILAEACLRHGIKLVHLGSGCIYRYDYKKSRPITETRAPDFFDLYYSRTKIYADQALEILSRRFNILIARIRIPLDDRCHPGNILTKLLGFSKVVDIPNSVTYIPDLIRALKHLLKTDARGIYNIVNDGSLRYPHLLDIYRKYDPDFKYRVVPYEKLKLVRTNLLLSTDKLKKTGFKVRDINQVLEECVRNYVRS